MNNFIRSLIFVLLIAGVAFAGSSDNTRIYYDKSDGEILAIKKAGEVFDFTEDEEDLGTLNTDYGIIRVPQNRVGHSDGQSFSDIADYKWGTWYQDAFGDPKYKVCDPSGTPALCQKTNWAVNGATIGSYTAPGSTVTLPVDTDQSNFSTKLESCVTDMVNAQATSATPSFTQAAVTKNRTMIHGLALCIERAFKFHRPEIK